MKELSLEKAAGYSFALHLAFVVIIGLLGFRSSVPQQAIYTVNLVSTDTFETPAQSHADNQAVQKVRRQLPPKKTPSEAVSDYDREVAKSKSLAVKKARDARQSRIKQAQEQAFAEKAKIEKLRELELQSRIEQIKKEAMSKGKAGSSNKPLSSAAKSRMLDEYAAKIDKDIKKNWVFTDVENKKIRTEISITVQKNGKIDIIKVESPSGNRAFDLSVIKAIRKTGFVAPPPFGGSIEFTLRFYPDE